MPENLTTRVTDAIRQSIVDAEFTLGEALSESSLAARLGVSRTPVREALTTLQRQGLIVIRPQSGSFVFMPSAEDVAELCEFRRLIETAALRFAHVRRREQALVQMREAITAAFEMGDLPDAEQLVDEHASQMAIGFRALRRSEAPS